MKILLSDWKIRRGAWARCMQDVANSFGITSPLYRVMGSIAWGRFKGEACVADSLQNAIFGTAYLEGYRDALLAVGRETGAFDTKGLECIHDAINEYTQRAK